MSRHARTCASIALLLTTTLRLASAARATPSQTEYLRQVSALVIETYPEQLTGPIEPLDPAEFPGDEPGEGYPLDFSACSFDYTQLGFAETDPLALLTTLAFDVAATARTMEAFGIPIQVWKPHLDRFEALAADLVAQVESPAVAREDALHEAWGRRDLLIEELVGVLNRFHSEQPELAPHFSPGGDCGAGEIPVELTTRPPGADVSYIPLFKYKLCQARRLDPLDTTACDGWVSAVKVIESLSGKYAFLARWSDGATKTGVFDIDDSPMVEVDGLDVIRIVISR